MPPIAALIPIIELIIKAAPVGVNIYKHVKETVKSWFDGGVITIEEQARLMAWADQHEKDTLAGIVPKAFVVDPD